MMPLPDPQALDTLVVPAHAGHRAIGQLHKVLSGVLQANSLEQRELAFEHLARWVTERRKVPTVAGAPVEERAEMIAGLGPLPAIADVSTTPILDAVRHDKKVVSGRLHFVLPTAIGAAAIVDDVTEKEMREALRKVGFGR